jgi:hypothetical protein
VKVLTGEQVELPTAALVDVAVPVAEWRDLDASTSATLADSWRPADL